MQLLVKFQSYQDAFTEMIRKFEFTWDGHLERNNIGKHHIDLVGQEILPAHATFYRGELAAWKFLASELDRIVARSSLNLPPLGGSH